MIFDPNASGLRHEFALEDLRTIRQNLDGANLTTFEYEFIMGILENERLSEEVCKLSKKEFPILRGIAIKLRKQKWTKPSAGHRT